MIRLLCWLHGISKQITGALLTIVWGWGLMKLFFWVSKYVAWDVIRHRSARRSFLWYFGGAWACSVWPFAIEISFSVNEDNYVLTEIVLNCFCQDNHVDLMGSWSVVGWSGWVVFFLHILLLWSYYGDSSCRSFPIMIVLLYIDDSGQAFAIVLLPPKGWRTTIDASYWEYLLVMRCGCLWTVRW